MTRRCLLGVRVALIVAGLARPAEAGPDAVASPNPADSWVPSVLFVGNSFTYGAFQPVRGYNAAAITDENFGLPRNNPRAEAVEPGPFGGIPGIYQKLADEAGLPCEVHIEAVSAQTLAFHAQYALPVLAQRRWDVVVLQDYSTGPLPLRRRGNPDRFFSYATLLEQAVHTFTPRARLFLYETWPRADLTYRANQPYSGEGIEVMAAELHDAYYQEAARDADFAGVAPVGDAWLRAIRDGTALTNPFEPRETGKINLWARDSYHPSVHGAYLAALGFFNGSRGWMRAVSATMSGPPSTSASPAPTRRTSGESRRHRSWKPLQIRGREASPRPAPIVCLGALSTAGGPNRKRWGRPRRGLPPF